MAVNHRKLLFTVRCTKCPGSHPINPFDKPSCIPCAGCYSTCSPPNPQLSPPPPLPPPLLQPPSHKTYKLPVILIVAIVILGTAFLLFTCFIIYRFCSYWYCSRRRRRRSGPRQLEEDDGPNEFLDEDHGPVVDHPIWYIRTVGLDPSVIEAITIVKYKRGEGLIDGTDCSVCLSEFEEDEALRLLPKCSHAFHIPCIDTWLRSHTNCPMCRARIVADNTAPFPPQEAVSIARNEEILIAVPESDSREGEAEGSGRGESMSEIGVKIDEISGMDCWQPVRRSVSMDALSASMISSAVVDAFGRNSVKQLDGEKERESSVANHQNLLRLTGSPSIERLPMQSGTGTSAVKRSLSCSAKMFLSRHGSRNHITQ